MSAQRAAVQARARQPYPVDRLVSELVADRAAMQPDSIAVVGADRSLTYAELDAWGNALARRLRRSGVERNVLAGLCVDRSAALVAGALGILKTGGAYVAMDPAYPADRLAYMLEDSQARVVVTTAQHAGLFTRRGLEVILADDPFDSGSLDPAADVAVGPPAGPHDLAYVIYTSGSSGRPKGVMIEHGSLLNLVYWHRRAFSITPNDRATQVASPAFDATVWELWPHLTAGATVVIAPEECRADAAAMRDWLVAQKITITFLPTPLAAAALMLPWPKDGALRVMLTGGDALHRHPSPDLPFELVNNYGPTEGTVVSTSGVVPRHSSGAAAPTIGCPVSNVATYVVDGDLRLVDVGEVGELLIGGDLLARGYLNQPALTAERFLPNPFVANPSVPQSPHPARLYRTGDLVRQRPTGEFDFVGRADDQAKIRGYRIELGEISVALETHPDVVSSVAVAREGPNGDKRLVAYVVTSRSVSEEPLREHLAARLPGYMVPAALVMLDQLPSTANGKVDRAALPTPEEAAGPIDEALDGPANELEAVLENMIATLLGRPTVGRRENFFVLGGHSLLGAQLIARIRDRFGVQLTLKSLFDHPTVAEMASEVEDLILADLDNESPQGGAVEVLTQIL